MSAAEQTPQASSDAEERSSIISTAPAADASRAERTFVRVLDGALTDCHLRWTLEGRVQIVGNRAANCVGALEIRDPRFFEECLSRSSLGMAECYMAGGFEVTHGALSDVLTALLRSGIRSKLASNWKLMGDVALIKARNWFRAPEENVQFHYDIGDELFESFLDPTLTYSCGYALNPSDSLEDLQQNKLRRICEKLRLRQGDRLLDIGCGFGGLLLFAARHYGVSGVGITLSQRHLELGRQRIAEAGLNDRISLDFRDHTVPWNHEFDKVVSVGMMEHLPRGEYSRYVGTIRGALAKGGLGLIHTIGCNAQKNRHDPFIQKYIFPRSAQPRLSEITSQLEAHGLPILDVENMVRHYALTTQRWLENFQRNFSGLPQDKYDERFRRMWEFYLHAGTAAARASESALYQVLFTNDPARDLPWQRV